jgi:NADH dehydrogenase
MTEKREQPHVVIIGGGFGGLATAKGLASADVQITLIDRSNHHLFQPLLYQVATAGLSPADIAYPIRTVLRNQENVRVLLGEVTRIDLGKKRLALADGAEMEWDYLVIAAGARTNYFDKEDAWRPHALGLKDVDEALEIRRRVLMAFEAAERETDTAARERLLTFVIIGGGPTGVEIAGALSDLARTVLSDDFRSIDPAQAKIVLLERSPRLLPGGFHDKLAIKAKRQLEELGVDVRLGSGVDDIDEKGVRVGETRIESATVFWTAGVKARGVVRTLGVELDRVNRVKTKADCSIPEHPEAFAIGDIGCFVPEGTNEPLPGVAQVALQQGAHVARIIDSGGKKRPTFSYWDKGIMATIGRSRAVAQMLGGKVRFTGFLAWMAWLAVHLWFLIGFRNRASVILNWFWNYMTYRRGARLITGHRSWELLPIIAGHSAERAKLEPAKDSERRD